LFSARKRKKLRLQWYRTHGITLRHAINSSKESTLKPGTGTPQKQMSTYSKEKKLDHDVTLMKKTYKKLILVTLYANSTKNITADPGR
jgi:hypothetical protein